MDMIQTIKAMIEEDLLEDPIEIKEDTSLFKDQVLDSLSLSMLVAFIEDTFEVKVKPLDIVYENFDTLNNIKAFIERKKAE